MTYLHKNMEILRATHEKLCEAVNVCQPDSRLEIVMGPSGKEALRILSPRQVFLHSLYNPEKEARLYVQAQEITDERTIVVYGFGLGYHLEELLKIVGEDVQIEVFQLGIAFFKTSLMTRDLSGLLADRRIRLHITDDLSGFIKDFKGSISKALTDKGKLLIHKNSLLLLPQQAVSLKDTLEEWLVKIDTANSMDELLLKNFRANQNKMENFIPITRFFGQFKDIPIFVISAGPSLERELRLLHKAREFGLLICVGTALRPLLENGIVPDFTVAIDPQLIVKKQFTGISCFPPLIFFPTVSPEVIDAYPGKKLYALKQGWAVTENKARELGVGTVESGGSVATAALDIAVQLGGSPIVLVGQDLAFYDGKTHSEGTIYEDQRYELASTKVLNNAGQWVTTGRNLNIYRKWIENYICRQSRIKGKLKFINTSLTGAVIRGTLVMPLPKILARLSDQNATIGKMRQKISELLKG